MRTAAYNVGVASDRRRRKNVQSTFFLIVRKLTGMERYKIWMFRKFVI